MAIAFKKPVEDKSSSSSIIPDLWGIALLALSLLLVCSLISYSSLDNGINADAPGDVHNWAGPGGAMVADILYTAFGLQALFVPVATGFGGVLCLLHRRREVDAWRATGFACLFFGFAILLQGFTWLQSFLPFPIGGLLGVILERAFAKVLSVLGARIIGLSLLLAGVVLFTRRRLLEHMAPLSRLSQLKSLFHRKKIVNPVATPIVSAPAPLPVAVEKPFVLFTPPKAAEPDPDNAVNIVERDTTNTKRVVEEAEQESKKRVKEYELPPLKLLDYDAPPAIAIDEAFMRNQAQRLEQTFAQFGIVGHVREIRPGPVVTMYEFVPAPGIKLSRIAALADDIAMAMEAIHVRIVAPIPGKGAVGIEVPNERRELVFLKEIVADPAYRKETNKLCMAVGKDVEGKPYFLNLADMPHLLIAGTTGSGKSVSVNAMICSILYRATPDDVRFLMIDPKMLELSIYEGIPHLLLPPIIDSKKAAVALRWAVREMDQRYLLMNEVGVRDINGYNERVEAAAKGQISALPQRDGEQQHGKMPYIVVVVDEYADLIAVGGRDVEGYVMRLAQKARASGIHVVLATQRPSVDVITGVIKANFPVRISFRLASSPDSKTIINRNGAEKLLGKGDALIMPPGTNDLVRVHGAYISEKELVRVIEFWKAQSTPHYHMSIISPEPGDEDHPDGLVNEKDEKYDEAIAIVMRTGKCSTSWLQRQLGVGYNRAARMVERMESDNIVGPILNARGDREIFGRPDSD